MIGFDFKEHGHVSWLARLEELKLELLTIVRLAKNEKRSALYDELNILILY